MMTLFQLRKQMELDQQQEISGKSIAHLAGISASSYCRYESGKAIPNVLIAANLALALHVELPELVQIIRATVEREASSGPEHHPA